MSAQGGNMRLPAPRGTFIDRAAEVTFEFDGRAYTGFAGDSIASALAAHGVRLIARSFKYHRPRGILSLSGHDGNVLVQIGNEPNVRADARRITPGLRVEPQNVIGSLERDYGTLIEKFSRFLPVGFYYHAFFKPRGAWRLWEPAIRRLAGLGKLDTSAHHGRTDKRFHHADVAVVGGGAAGMSAALAAAAEGARVLLIDDGAHLGGALSYARFAPDARGALDRLAALTEAVVANTAITVLSDAWCTGWFADNWLTAITADCFHQVRARAVVCATGVVEQPAVFRNNDLPGIMLGSAAQRLLQRYAVKPGRRAVVLTANSEGYGVALDLHDAGIEVVAVCDLYPERESDDLHDAVVAAGIEVHYAHTIREASADSSGLAVGAVRLAPLDASSAVKARSVDCDLVCVSAGFVPAAQLVCQMGGSMRYDAAIAGLRTVMPTAGAKVDCAGAVAGVFDLDAVSRDGERAGRWAARAGGSDSAMASEAPRHAPERSRNHPWPIAADGLGREFIDFDEDLQIKDIEQAVAAGYTDFDLVKRYSTVVMGPSQGRQSAQNALRVTMRARGADIDGALITTQRPPVYPEPIGHLAGRPLHPLRRTAMHDAHLALGAHMIPAGTWLRPGHYGPADQVRRCAEREAQTLRNAVGLIDVSTLGKIEVRGPDSAEFLERIYTFRYRKQAVGKLRYVLATDETGVITDDGIAARFADDYYYVSATTTGADVIYRQMLRWNAQWNLDVTLINVTSAWCGINVAGPLARALLQPLVDDVDLSAATFAFQDCREAHIDGQPAKLMRVGFVGELGWEVHVPAHFGATLWARLLRAGEALGVSPVGIEAQRLLRLEKGHIIVSQDTDGLTCPQEADMQWAVADEKPYFVGQRALAALGRREQTRQLVGFALPAKGPIPEECNLTMAGDEIIGRVTSIGFSAACHQVIGLAYVRPEMAVPGTHFDIKLTGRMRRVHAEVVRRPFYDPDNARQAL